MQAAVNPFRRFFRFSFYFLAAAAVEAPEKICYNRRIFTGHRTLPADPSPLRELLRRQLLLAAEEGYTDFLSGGAMGFDLLAAETVLDLKAEDPRLRLWMILPYEAQAARYPHRDRLRYEALLARADLVRYTAGHYYTGCFLTRDRVLAESADGCICYLTRSTGGTAYTVRHAALRDIPIINLAELL